MGDKLRKFKIDRQQEKQPFRPKRERPSLDLDEDMDCDAIRYRTFERPIPQEKREHENQEG